MQYDMILAVLFWGIVVIFLIYEEINYRSKQGGDRDS